jgi:hypothetical protein
MMLVIVGLVRNIDGFKSGLSTPNWDIFVPVLALLISLFLIIRASNSMLNDRTNMSVFSIYLLGFLFLILIYYL